MNNAIDHGGKNAESHPRPEWVRRINEVGSSLDLQAVIPLDAESLMSSAVKNTGLRDFGSDGWYEPFKVLTVALDSEANLNLVGRLITRSELLMHLEARLQIEELYKKHPEIDEQTLSPPMLIIGSGRSGTSVMQNLLSLDPDNGTPKHWEALFPCPPPTSATYASDPRIEIGGKRTDLWNQVTPELLSMHEFSGNMPTEMIQLDAISFQATGWLQFYGMTPSFVDFVERRDSIASALAYTKKVLKILQWKNPRKRWLLKSPDMMRFLPDVFSAFPDVQLIWMHRDPIKTVSSAASLVKTMFWIRSDKPLDRQAVVQVTNPAVLAATFDVCMNQLESGVIPKSQVHHIRYQDLIRDPLDTIALLYQNMEVKFSDEARKRIHVYLTENPRESRPAHKYNAGNLQQQSDTRRHFERYQRYFRIESES